MPRTSAARTLAAALAVSALGLTACGAGPERTALAITETTWTPDGRLVLGFECAELDSVDVEPGEGIDGLPLITAWGRPTVGRCTTEVTIPVPEGTTRIDDATTGQIVDLPPR